VAVRRLLAGLLEELRAWEPGVLAHDVEALHQWRVALRTARALLGALGDVLGPRARPLRRRLRLLQAETGPLRDLDVHLDQVGDEPAALVAWLRARRAEERERVGARLRSERYRRWLARWAALVVSDEQGEAGGDPIGAVARVRVWRAWRVVIEHAEAVGDDCDAEALHEVRKDCKRLRYLIELTSSVLDDGAVRELIGRLKPLQSVLGSMQDLAVQRETLAAAGPGGAAGLEAVVAEEGSARLRSIEAVRAIRDPRLDRAARALAGLARTAERAR
jgi:CHAD domain-containing protein